MMKMITKWVIAHKRKQIANLVMMDEGKIVMGWLEYSQLWVHQEFKYTSSQEPQFTSTNHKRNQWIVDTSWAISKTKIDILHDLNKDGQLEGWITDHIVLFIK